MLTLRTIKQLRDYLKQVVTICDELIQTRERCREIRTADDLQNVKYVSQITPQEYYRFVYLEKIIELNKKGSSYYIYCEHFYPQNEELAKYRNGYTAQYILKDMDFEHSKTIFRKFILELLHQEEKNDKELFYIY